MGKIELLILQSSSWNYLTVCQQISSKFFKNKITDKLLTYKSYVYQFNCVQTIDYC